MRTSIAILILCSSFLTSNAYADDWGCEVLLCLANPSGPTAVAECIPPIERLWKQLAKGKPFPTCDMASDVQSGNSAYARMGYDYFDYCPKKTMMFEEGVPPNFEGIGKPRVCATRLLGYETHCENDGEGSNCYQVPLYENATYLQANASPRVIDVFINNTPWSRVRW